MYVNSHEHKIGFCFSLKVVRKNELTKFRKIFFSSDFQFLKMKELKRIPRDAHSYMIEP
jgi:hypothetical protein